MESKLKCFLPVQQCMNAITPLSRNKHCLLSILQSLIILSNNSHRTSKISTIIGHVLNQLIVICSERVNNSLLTTVRRELCFTLSQKMKIILYIILKKMVGHHKTAHV